MLLLLVLGVVAERSSWFPRLLGAGVPARLWIWVDASPREVRPRAFELIRDFEVEDPPPAASLEVACDPECVVRVNGERIGSNRYRADSPIVRYELAGTLRPGNNRLAIEARSAIGSGGVTARVVDRDGRTRVASDGAWRVYPGVWRLISNPDIPLPEAPRVRILGRSPFARWGLQDVEDRPTYASELDGSGLEPAAAWRPVGGDSEWRPLPRRSRAPISGDERIEVDFGGEVAGLLHLDVQATSPAEGMVFFAETPSDALERSPDRVVVAVPNLGFWQDVEPRRFRYVTIIGIPTVRAVSVVRMQPDAVRRAEAEAREVGLFGMAIEPSPSPLVESLRRRLLSGGDFDRGVGISRGDR